MSCRAVENALATPRRKEDLFRMLDNLLHGLLLCKLFTLREIPPAQVKTADHGTNPVGRGFWARFFFSRTSSALPHTSILQKNKCEFCSADIPSLPPPSHVFEESKWPSGALLKPFLFAEVPQTSFFYDLQRPAAQPATVPVQSDEDTHRTCVCLSVCLSVVCMYVSVYVCT